MIAGGSYAVADGLITGKKVKNGSLTGKDIKNGSITSRDIKRGSVSLARLSKGTQALIRKAGTPGPAGPKGAPGTGSIGGSGIGPTGTVTKVTSLGAYSEDPAVKGWLSRGSDCSSGGPVGSVTLTDTIQFGPYPDGNAASAAVTNRYAGKTVDQISYLSYTAKYDQTGTDFQGGTPYFRIFSHSPGGSPFDNSIIYSPNTQPDAGSSQRIRSGRWSRFTPTSGTLRFNDDAGDNPDVTWDKLKQDHGNEIIDQIRIQGGCSGAYSNNATGYADSLSVEIAGKQETFDFGRN